MGARNFWGTQNLLFIDLVVAIQANLFSKLSVFMSCSLLYTCSSLQQGVETERTSYETIYVYIHTHHHPTRVCVTHV